MPWQEMSPMDQRVLFISDYLRGTETSFASLCRRYGVSRKTGYKWVARYKENGVNGLEDGSRRPNTHPHTIPYPVKQAIIELRTKGRIRLGPKKIQTKLAERFPNQTPPSITSIHNILKRAGLINTRRKRSCVEPYPDPFQAVTAPNQLWSVDFKGQFKVGSGHWCYPLTVMDHQSRYLLDCRGLKGTSTPESQRAFERIFREYGLPERIRSDNGVPFATRATGGLSRLSIWWIKLGILPERIQPGKPQQNGQHERMHRTLKQAVTHPVSKTLSAQQRQLNAFREEYNEYRPHEALNQEIPSKHYTPSLKRYPDRLPEPAYPDYFMVKKVRDSGIVYWNNGQVYVSHLLNGEWIGMEEVCDGKWDLYFGPVRIGSFDQQQKRGKGTAYWSVKV
ncbi:MAG: integrase core domain-containing protein [Candidatus Thiodiazotropha taylori]|nr:integrase core domain-containing protein [Candidatus Thiodiazotropha taylori]MCG8066362.1 integrase core domain-containing protein [Candidatus Thiodiazotropha taylori]